MSYPENVFESGERKLIPAVLVYLFREKQVLMIHRNSQISGKVDHHEGKWNGLGGKCEKDESPLEAACREVEEESGFVFDSKNPNSTLKSLGVLQFPNFKPQKNEDWLVFVFSGIIPQSENFKYNETQNEGDLHWVSIDQVLNLNLWPGDHFFIPYVLQGKPFMGTLWYQNQQVVRTWIEEL